MNQPYILQRGALERPAGLPRDFISGSVPHLAHLLTRQDVRSRILADSMPIPGVQDREGYHDDRHLEYWLGGFADAEPLHDLVAEKPLVRALEFGGCSARVARHLADYPNWEVWLSDVNARYIRWANAYSTKPIRAFINMAFPPLPVESNFFDVVSAFSVFTHIDELDTAWLAEIRRILKPGGLAYLTVTDEDSWKYTQEHKFVRDQLTSNGTKTEVVDALSRPLIADRFKIMTNDEAYYNCAIFLRRSHIKAKWSLFFDIREFRPLSHGYQTVVIASKPPTGT